MSEVYIAPEVQAHLDLHSYLNDPLFCLSPFAEQITVQANTVLRAHGEADTRARMQILCWWPGARGKSWSAVCEADFSLEDARVTVSREYGFPDWATVEAMGDARPEARFEAALGAVLAGDVAALDARLTADPDLATARSRFGHGASLLHYCGSNGVETHRQKVPMTIVTVAETLIAHGADKRAEAAMYGGGQTALDLAETSAHPMQAGVSEALAAVLR